MSDSKTFLHLQTFKLRFYFLNDDLSKLNLITILYSDDNWMGWQYACRDPNMGQSTKIDNDSLVCWRRQNDCCKLKWYIRRVSSKQVMWKLYPVIKVYFQTLDMEGIICKRFHERVAKWTGDRSKQLIAVSLLYL